MSKYFIEIKLTSIKVSDISLGRNWNIKLIHSMISGNISFNLKRAVQKINKPLVQKTAQLESSKLNVKLELKEKDPKWDDKSFLSTVIDLSKKEKVLIFKIPVKGQGQREKNKIINVKVTLNIKLTPAIRYIADVWPNGWLKVKLSSGDTHPVPYFLKVEFLEVKIKRLYFKILEGKLKNKTVSIEYKQNCFKKYFLNEISSGRHKRDASVIYDRIKRKLTVIGVGSFDIVEAGNPLPLGSYDLEIPHEPHKSGGHYQKKTRYAKSWFRIGHSGDHFLHVGRASDGCVTVLNQKKWTKLYRYLINRRKDAKSVGTITIR